MTGAKPKSHGRLSISASPRPRDLMAPQRVKGAWAARIVTLFPEAFPGTLGLSLTGKALAEGLWALVSQKEYSDRTGLLVREIESDVGMFVMT